MHRLDPIVIHFVVQDLLCVSGEQQYIKRLLIMSKLSEREVCVLSGEDITHSTQHTQPI